MSTPSLINCPACNAQVSNQAPACPRCGQPIASATHQTSDSAPAVFNNCSVCEEPIAPPATTCPACAHWKLTGEFPDHGNETRGSSTAYTYQSQPILPSPRFQSIAGSISAIKKIGIGCLAVLAVVIAYSNIARGVRTNNADRNKQNRSVQASPTPITFTSSAVNNNSFSADGAGGFQSREGKAILAGFIIKPALTEMLDDPDSLQDLEVTSVLLSKRCPARIR
jgi:hypothetical protein